MDTRTTRSLFPWLNYATNTRSINNLSRFISFSFFYPQAKDLKSEISKELTTLNIEHHAPETSRDRDGNVVSRPYIIVDSWNALKGVEFDAVIIAGVDSLSEYKSEDSEISFEAKAGLYTAMTRAKDHLIMLYENKDVVVTEIEAALNSDERLEEG